MAVSSLAPLARGRQLVDEGLARPLRAALGLSAEDVAAVIRSEGMGCSASAVLMWERRDRRPSGAVGRRYCELVYEMADSEVPLAVAGTVDTSGQAS